MALGQRVAELVNAFLWKLSNAVMNGMSTITGLLREFTFTI